MNFIPLRCKYVITVIQFYNGAQLAASQILFGRYKTGRNERSPTYFASVCKNKISACIPMRNDLWLPAALQASLKNFLNSFSPNPRYQKRQVHICITCGCIFDPTFTGVPAPAARSFINSIKRRPRYMGGTGVTILYLLWNQYKGLLFIKTGTSRHQNHPEQVQ